MLGELSEAGCELSDGDEGSVAFSLSTIFPEHLISFISFLAANNCEKTINNYDTR